jgi:hypothetical protein
MTAKSEGQLITEIMAELDTLVAKFKVNDTSIAAGLVAVDALIVTLDTVIDGASTTVGPGIAVSIAADLAVVKAVLDLL